jgi:RHS repeat-associated protein
MLLRRVFQRDSSSKEGGRSRRRRSRSTLVHLFVDRLEEISAPNMLLPGSLAVGLGAATGATVATALARPLGEWHGPSTRGPLHHELEARATRGASHPHRPPGHAQDAADRTHHLPAGKDWHRIAPLGHRRGPSDHSSSLTPQRPLNGNSGSVPLGGRAPQPSVTGTNPTGQQPTTATSPSGSSGPAVALVGASGPSAAAGTGAAGAPAAPGAPTNPTPGPVAAPAPPATNPAPTNPGAPGTPTTGGGTPAPPAGSAGTGGGRVSLITTPQAVAQQLVGTDVTNGGQASVTYAWKGNNANRFAIQDNALQLTLGDGSTFPINNPSSGGPATVGLNVFLDNQGTFTQFLAGDNLTITGAVTVKGTTFDGTLVTANLRSFGVTNDAGITQIAATASVTGGLLAQQPAGLFRVGSGIGVLYYLPGFTIPSWRNSFAYQTRKVASDAAQLMKAAAPPPPVTPGYNGIAICSTCPTGNYPASAVGTLGPPGATGSYSVALYDGSYQYDVIDLTIPGRGFDWSFERVYRSDVTESGPLGANWDFNYDRRLEVVTAQNLEEIQQSFPTAQPGDVLRQDGLNRGDLYVQDPDGSYTAPAGFFTRLVQDADGSFIERDATGNVVDYDAPAADGTALMTSLSDRNGDTMQFQHNGLGQLVRVIDTMGRPINYLYDTDPNSVSDGLLIAVQDFTGRTLSFHYDAAGNLVGVTSPAVTGTPTGNDFPQGKTEAYTYSSGFSDEALSHNLLTITAPNEVADGGPPRVVLTYGTDPSLPSYDRVTSQMEGGTNATGVPAGGTMTYQYQVQGTAAPGDLTTAVFQTTVTDRNGNLSLYQFNQLGNIIESQVFNNRNIRPSDPISYTTTYQYNKDSLLLGETDPQGNSVQYVYDSNNPDRFLQGDLLAEIQHADTARGGDQSTITSTYTYEPIYDQIHSMTEARGNDPSYVPPNGGRNSPGRYRTVYTYDYQEGTNFAGLGQVLGMSAAQAQQLLAQAGIPMGLGDVNGDGLTNQIAGNLIREQDPTVTLLPGSHEAGVEGSTLQPIVTLYTYNKFGQMTSQTDPERNVDTYTYYPADSPDGSGVIEVPGADPATGGYLASTVTDTKSAPGRDSGTNPTPAKIQNIYSYDEVGNVIRSVDGRGIATDSVVNQLNEVVEVIQAAAHNVFTPGVAEPMPLTDFQYLERFFYDANDNVVLTEVEDRGNTSNVQGNPPAADLPILSVDLASISTGGNGTTTLNDAAQGWTTNQWAGQAVRITSGPGAGAFALIVSNTATQLTLSTPWSVIPDASSHYAIYPLINPDPIGGRTAFQDTVTQYDILDNPVETVEEVANGAHPQFLDTLTRYDPNGNVVLTVEPEGNAVATYYDERDLVYQVTEGASAPPPLALLAATDPRNYDLRGGLPSTTTDDYDLNGNLIQTVSADDTDGSLANNAQLPSGTSTGSNTATTLNDTHQDWIPDQWEGRTILIVSGTGAGQLRTIASNTAHQLTVSRAWTTTPDVTSVYAFQGDRTRYVYDGFDRLTSVIDAVGNQTVYQYDPASEVVRTLQFGPVGGPSPTSNGPNTLPGPVSLQGVIQAANLVNSHLLAASESSYDELGRDYQDAQVLFVNTIPTQRPADVKEGASDLGLGSLTPGQTQPIPGVTAVSILGRVTDRTEYDRDSRVTFTVADDLATSRTLYDGVGRAIKTVDPQGNTVEMAYDGDGNIIETRQTDVAQVPGVAPEIFLTTSFFDSLDRFQETVDNLGETTYYLYDSRNNLVAMADASGPPGRAIARRAFPDGPRTVDTTNLFGNVTLSFYDGLDRQTMQEQVLTASGQGDGVHIGASIYGIKDDPSAPESFPTAPDPSQGGGDGIIRTGTIWDKNSLQSAVIDDNGNVTVDLYDNLDRQVAETTGLTVDSSLTKTAIMGPEVIPTPTAATIDNPSVIATAQINTQLAEVQAGLTAVAALFPPLASTVDPPTTTITGYDPSGNALIQEDQNGSELFTRYDAIDRPIAVRIFRAGQHDSFSGDPIFAPAPVSILTNNESNPTVVTGTTEQNFQYDGLSRMTYAFDNNDPTNLNNSSRVTDAYDSLSRLIEEAQNGLAIDSAWRADDLRSSLTYPNGRVEVYTYDTLSRMKTVTDKGAAQPIATYQYIGEDRVLRRAYPQNGTQETFLDNSGTVDAGYDGMGRPTQMRSLRPDGSLIVGFTYTYDRMGNKLTEGKLHDPSNSETYAYDSAYRLISFQRGPGGVKPLQSRWKLDGVGNWTSVDSQTRQHSSNNEVIQTQSGGTTTSLKYDNNGNETDDGTLHYSYDALNRLTEVTRKSDGAVVASYTYDAMGRRISKDVTHSGSLDVVTRFLYDGQETIEERNKSNTITQQYVYGAQFGELLVLDRNLTGGPTATGPGNQRLFYYQNALGSVYALANTGGNIVEAYQYDAYGHQTVFGSGPGGVVTFGPGAVILASGISAVGNPYLFTSQRLDPETGLFYYGARYYDPVLGRFMSRDPLGFAAGDLDLYGYVGDDPVDFADPDGLGRVGHHWIPASVLKALYKEGSITKQAFEVGMGAYSGWLGHKHGYGEYGVDFKVKHSEYNKEVSKLLNDYIKEKGKMDGQAMLDMINKVQNADPATKIGQFNKAIRKCRTDWVNAGPRRGFKKPPGLQTYQKRGQTFVKQMKTWKAVKLAKLASKGVGKAVKSVAGVGKKIPGVGILVSLAFWRSDVQAKGWVGGTINTVVDAIPLVGTGKGIAELIAGQDLIPDQSVEEPDVSDEDAISDNDAELDEADVWSEDEDVP